MTPFNEHADGPSLLPIYTEGVLSVPAVKAGIRGRG